MSSVLPSPWSNAPLVTGISNLMASLRWSSFYAHHWWRDSGMDLASLTHFSAEDSFVFEFVWLIRSLFWPMIVNVFVAFHERGIVPFCCSWLKGEPPGTRTLAAGSQKKSWDWSAWLSFFQVRREEDSASLQGSWPGGTSSRNQTKKAGRRDTRAATLSWALHHCLQLLKMYWEPGRILLTRNESWSTFHCFTFWLVL